MMKRTTVCCVCCVHHKQHKKCKVKRVTTTYLTYSNKDFKVTTNMVSIHESDDVDESSDVEIEGKYIVMHL